MQFDHDSVFLNQKKIKKILCKEMPYCIFIQHGLGFNARRPLLPSLRHGGFSIASRVRFEVPAQVLGPATLATLQRQLQAGACRYGLAGNVRVQDFA